MEPVSSPFIATLKSILPETTWAWVIPAIQEDNLVWGSLNAFRECYKVEWLEEIIQAPEDCAPAALALKMLAYPEPPASLRSLPLIPVDSGFSDRIQASQSQPVDSLENAGLQALYLRQLRGESGSWDDWSHDLWSTPSSALSCLYGIVPDQIDLLRAMVPSASSAEQFTPEQVSAYQAVIHVVLSNPLKLEAQVEILNMLLEELNFTQRFQLIEHLYKIRPGLASRLVKHLTKDSPDLESSKPESILDYLTLLGNLYTLQKSHHIAGKASQEVPALIKSIKLSRSLQSKFATRVALAAIGMNDHKTALAGWEQAVQIEPEDELIAPAYLLYLLELGRIEEVKGLLQRRRAQGLKANPLIALIERMVEQGDPAGLYTGQAKERLGEAANDAIDSLETLVGADSQMDIYDISLQAVLAFQLTQKLAENGCYPQAIRALYALNRAMPKNLLGLVYLANAQQYVGKYSEAADILHLAVALDSHNLDARRILATCLEANHDWDAALAEWGTILERQETPPAGDLYASIACAIRTGHYDRAIQSCQVALKNDAQDGLAYALLGKATLAYGEQDEARTYLEQAVQLTPQHPFSWLSLADYYRANDMQDERIRTLLSGSYTIANRPEIPLALGEYYLETDAPTQALAELKKASETVAGLCNLFLPFSLVELLNHPAQEQSGFPVGFTMRGCQDWLSDNVTGCQLKTRVTMQYGKTLLRLGHDHEATQVLRQAYEDFGRDAGLASAYAEALMKQERYEEAVEPLKTVVESGASDAGAHVAYARCLMALNKNGSYKSYPAAAKSVPLLNEDQVGDSLKDLISAQLEKAIQMDPQNAEAKVYLGEAHLQRGDFENALGLFNEVMDDPKLRQGSWKNRIALDVGKVTLKLGRGDLALAALKDADQNDPLIQQNLAEAYQEMSLVDEAFKTAQSALQLAPDDLTNLGWFVDFSQGLKDHHDAILPQALQEASAALRHAIDLSPARSDLRLAQGALSLKTGDLEGARGAFHSLVPGDPLSPVMNTTPPELYQAGQRLLELGDASAAVSCLEHALQDHPYRSDGEERGATFEDPSLLDFLAALTEAYKQNGQPDQALETLNQALTIEPNEFSLYLSKADLLLGASNSGSDTGETTPDFSEVIACLAQALDLEPGQPSILVALSLLERAIGDIPAALEHAKSLSQVAPAQGETAAWGQKNLLTAGRYVSRYASQALVLDLTQAGLAGDTLKPDGAADWPALEGLKSGAKGRAGVQGYTYPSELDYFCQCVEATLLKGDTPNAAKHLGDVIESTLQDARIQSLQARVHYRQGDHQAATSLLQSAIEIARERFGSAPQEQSPCNLQALAERFAAASTFRYIARTARELSRWDEELSALEQSAAFIPREPQAHLEMGIARVRQTEFRQMCQELEASQPAPAIMGAQEAQEKAQASIGKVVKSVTAWQDSDLKRVEDQVRRWSARCRAIFAPSVEHAQALAELPANPDDVAAQIACLRRVGKIADASRAAQVFPQEPAVLTQLALTLEKEEPRKALLAAQSAVEILSQPQAGVVGKGVSGSNSDENQVRAIAHALQARLTFQTGNRAGDIEKAVAAIEKAIQFWPQEASWHALAARIYQVENSAAGLPDDTHAIAHLEQAVAIQPDKWEYAFDLGKQFLNASASPQAIEMLTLASQNAADQGDVWNYLAEAYLNVGKKAEAKECLDRSLNLTPDDTHLMTLRGELALQEGDTRSAEKLARGVLEHQPDDPAGTLLLARSLSQMGKGQEAQDLLAKSFPPNPQTLPLFLERAKLIAGQEGPEAAIENLQDVVAQFPEQPALLETLAELYESAGQTDQALQAAQHALRAGHSLPQDNRFMEHARIHNLLGRLMRHAGQLDQAVGHLNEAIQLAPDFIEPYLELGQTHLDRRQYQEAIQVYLQAIQAEPDSANTYYHAGLAYKQCKDYVSAEQMLRQAAKMSPDDLTIQRQLGAVVALNLVHNRKP